MNFFRVSTLLVLFSLFMCAVHSSPAAADNLAQVERAMETSEEPSPTDEEPVCFPGSASVELENGSHKRMSDLNLGDKVKTGPSEFSEVYMFTHRMKEVRNRFVKLDLASGHSLSLTKSHYIYVNNALSPAEQVRKGDRVYLGTGEETTVVTVDKVYGKGLYNPQTTQGDIIVDGVKASTYTKTVQPFCAHALLAPLRVLYDMFGVMTTVLDNGAAKIFANVVPKGNIISV